jgi:hypothetical protein
MASNIKARPQEETVSEKEPPETAPDSPLLDRKLIRSAKKLVIRSPSGTSSM